MGNIFSGSEIVEMAVEIEKNGRDFYNKVSESLKDENIGRIFKYLAGQEEKHVKVFKNMLSTVKKYEPSEAYTDEYFSYMKALSEEHVFTKKNKGKVIADTVKDGRKAVELGLGFERDSILFYHEMKNFVLESEHNIINGLIKEEQMHLKKLSLLRRRCYA
ncbi:MAG: hypothetical protein A2047_02685 [Omnitrophica bacterium GWA2_41_15]|nr:MAG: hypothetical protein A2047_02685 [Omnitrophica bacterium GWA2_41_15]HAZ10083.1 hypothetical protein [Candidatus Omnitrophota bacterium]